MIAHLIHGFIADIRGADDLAEGGAPGFHDRFPVQWQREEGICVLSQEMSVDQGEKNEHWVNHRPQHLQFRDIHVI